MILTNERTGETKTVETYIDGRGLRMVVGMKRGQKFPKGWRLSFPPRRCGPVPAYNPKTDGDYSRFLARNNID
jgi:hypothetical protein